MKTLSLLPLIIFISISVNGQQLQGKIENLKMVKEPVMVYAFNYPNAKLLYETDEGKIYQLPPDNMRCLAPNYRSNMPYVKINPEGLYLNGQKINPQLSPNLLRLLKKIPNSRPGLIPQEKIIPLQVTPETLIFSNNSTGVKKIPFLKNSGK